MSNFLNLSSEKEVELALALERYIDPNNPEFDPDFTRKIFARQPQWFSAEEFERIKTYLVTK